MTPIAYIKYGAIAAALIGYSFLWFHLGGLSSDVKLANDKTAQEAQYAANLKTVADTLNKQIQDGVASRAAQQRIIDAYDQEKAKPAVTAGLAGELRDATQAASCPPGRQLPAAGTVARGTQTPATQSAGDPRLDRLSELTQAVFDASDADAKQMNAMIKLAP